MLPIKVLVWQGKDLFSKRAKELLRKHLEKEKKNEQNQ